MLENVSQTLLSVADAARLVGLTPAAIRYHDDDLAPIRAGSRRVRLYSAVRVAAWCGRRAAERAGR